MPSFYRSSIQQFLLKSASEIVGELSLRYARQGFTDLKSDQTEAWHADITNLISSFGMALKLAPGIGEWAILLEFVIPRKGKRIDAVLLANDSIIIFEFKTGMISTEAKHQVEEYALLLHYFHKSSDKRRIFPMVISPLATFVEDQSLLQGELNFDELPSTWIARTSTCDWKTLSERLRHIFNFSSNQQPIDPITWDSAPYHPVPTIVDAALALRSGLDIREIAHSEASEFEIGEVTGAIQSLVDQACSRHEFAICFLTGVPGSGKTLVGLGLAHSRQNQTSPIHFMSGNGPLVKVLQHLFTQQAMREKVPAPEAKIRARTLIENVHLFARQYTEDAPHETPSNNVIIFDEAQRAWNRQQNLRKFRRNYSEPEMLLSIMERHKEWSVVIALVGGGQEINDGEAGLEEWGRALLHSEKNWTVYASPEVLVGGESTAQHRLFDERDIPADQHRSPEITPMQQLHLRTSNRSLRAENLSKWVNAVIAGDSRTARDLEINKKFPLYLTRDIAQMKDVLHQESLGESRCGLAASSCAARLRAEGLEPDSSFHAEYPWEHWYLGGRGDVRSSFQCEVFATEFEIQGLELDWVGLCWGGDFIWDSGRGWLKRKFRPGAVSKWSAIKNIERQRYRENAYRVLLTRARQGLVIFVPKGERSDLSRSPEEFETTAGYLIECGVKEIG
jgi:Uncharacterized conserved protein (DUF2075)